MGKCIINTLFTVMQNCCKKDLIENVILHSFKAELNSILTGKEKEKYFLKMLSFPSTCSIVISGKLSTVQHELLQSFYTSSSTESLVLEA